MSCLLFAFDYRNCKVTKLMDILHTPHSGYQKIVPNSLPNFVTHSARLRALRARENSAITLKPMGEGGGGGGGGGLMLCYFLWQHCYIIPNDIRRSGVI